MSEIQPTQQRSVLARIFISPDESRLRAGWRLLLHTLLLFLFGIIISIVAGFIGFVNEPFTSILNQILNFIVITGSVYIARRWLDQRSFESLGLKLSTQTLFYILVGIGINFIKMGFFFILMFGL